MHRKRHQIYKEKIQVSLQTQKKEISNELDLHGYNIEEGIPKVEIYLDRAYLYSISPVRLVHGHGTGRLRKAIRGYLKSHPHVTRFGPADTKYGGEGVTLVYLDINELE